MKSPAQGQQSEASLYESHRNSQAVHLASRGFDSAKCQFSSSFRESKLRNLVISVTVSPSRYALESLGKLLIFDSHIVSRSWVAEDCEPSRSFRIISASIDSRMSSLQSRVKMIKGFYF
jgi:hypothetical protein